MKPVKPCKSCSCKNGDQFVHLSVVEEVLSSTCMPEDDFKWFIKEIKQKAGL